MPFSNPVIPGNVADPSVVRADGVYWAAATSGRWAPVFPIFRSRDLVRGHFWLIMATAVAMFVAEQVASTALDAAGEHIGSHPTIGGAIGDALGDLLVAPWAGMVISIVYFGLSGRGEPMPATGAAA